MISDTLPLGPRRDAVAKAEMEEVVSISLLDLAIDSEDWPLAMVAWEQIQVARRRVQELMDMWIMNVPGAAEFFDSKEKAGGTG